MNDNIDENDIKNIDIKKDTDTLLTLYKIANEEEKYFLKEHQSRIAFFTSLISVLTGATLYGITQIEEGIHAVFFLMAPIMIYAISNLAIHGSSRFYNRFVESVMKQAKIDQILGLTKGDWSNVDYDGAYWQNEPFMPYRNLNDRKRNEPSIKFYHEVRHGGYHQNAKWLFLTFKLLSVGLLIGLLIYADWLFNAESLPNLYLIIFIVISGILLIEGIRWDNNIKNLKKQKELEKQEYKSR